MEEKSIEYYKTKCEEQRIVLQSLQNKLRQIEEGRPDLKKGFLGLQLNQTYLFITKGRRIVGELLFEGKNFICYKRHKYDTKYYINKRYIEVIKELNYEQQYNKEDDDL